MILNDVDLFAAQFADDRLHAHTLHPDASADRVHVFVLGHDRDLRSFACLARNRPNHYSSVINLRNLGLEQMLNQLRRCARNHDSRSLRGFLHPCDNYAHALTHRKRLQPRLLFARHARFGLADVKNYIWTFNALHRGVHNLADTPDVLVVNRIALGFAHFLKDHLLRELCSDAPQNSFSHFGNFQLAADLRARVNLAGIIHCDLQLRVLHLLGRLDNRLHRKCVDLACFLVQLSAQVLLCLIVFACRDNNGVFHRAHYDLRINALLFTQGVNSVVKLACHR